VSTLREYNIKRHYDAKHEQQYKNLTGQLRIDKFNQMKKIIRKQQAIFKNQAILSNTAVKASFVVSQVLAKNNNTLCGWRYDKRMYDCCCRNGIF